MIPAGCEIRLELGLLADFSQPPFINFRFLKRGHFQKVRCLPGNNVAASESVLFCCYPARGSWKPFYR